MSGHPPWHEQPTRCSLSKGKWFLPSWQPSISKSSSGRGRPLRVFPDNCWNFDLVSCASNFSWWDLIHTSAMSCPEGSILQLSSLSFSSYILPSHPSTAFWSQEWDEVDRDGPLQLNAYSHLFLALNQSSTHCTKKLLRAPLTGAEIYRYKLNITIKNVIWHNDQAWNLSNGVDFKPNPNYITPLLHRWSQLARQVGIVECQVQC